MTDNPAPPQRRPRLSLLSLLLLTGLIASWITVAVLWRSVGPLRAEVRRLRDEVGELAVSDPNQFYAISLRVEPVVGEEWAWRLYVPPKKSALISAHYAWPPTPDNANSGGISRLELGPGEHVLRATLAPGEANRHALRVSTAEQSTVSSTRLPTATGCLKTSVLDGIQKTTTQLERGQPTSLLKATFEPCDGSADWGLDLELTLTPK